jgi:hypothetical protein
MRRDSRPGQASCCRLVTKRNKFNLHFAFMPPFQIGESRSARESFFQTRGGICCAATPASDPVVSGWSVSRFGHGRRPCSNASRLSPISDLRAAGRHRRALRLHNRTEASVVRADRCNKVQRDPVARTRSRPCRDRCRSATAYLQAAQRKAQ